MNNRIIRRAIALLTLTAALTMSLGAYADPLPVPHAPKDGPIVIIPPVNLLSPPAGVVLNQTAVLTWSNVVLPQKYVIKFVIAETGQTLRFNVPLESCGGAGFCTLPISETPLFDMLSDGDSFTWRVIAKHAFGSTKSAANMNIADTVSAPDSLLPIHGASLNPAANLTWDNDAANASYTLVVKHIASGERVIKHKLRADVCAAACSVDVFEMTDFVEGHGYQWFVKAKGYNGDKAKSAKQTFYPHYAAETGR